MPDYTADLRWLASTHPDVYKRIPPELLGDGALNQVHLSEHAEGAEEADAGIWAIMFYTDADTDTDTETEASEGQMCLVSLGVPRPEADTGDSCPEHTLAVSRPFCSRCSPHNNLAQAP